MISLTVLEIFQWVRKLILRGSRLEFVYTLTSRYQDSRHILISDRTWDPTQWLTAVPCDSPSFISSVLNSGSPPLTNGDALQFTSSEITAPEPPSVFDFCIVENDLIENAFVSDTSSSGPVSSSSSCTPDGDRSHSGGSTSPHPAPRPLRWVEPNSTNISSTNTPSFSMGLNSDALSARDVRRSIEKRRKTKVYKNLQSDVSNSNALAARKYREKRKKEVDVLLDRIQELEESLSTANLETKWWKMEAQRWKDAAESNK